MLLSRADQGMETGNTAGHVSNQSTILAGTPPLLSSAGPAHCAQVVTAKEHAHELNADEQEIHQAYDDEPNKFTRRQIEEIHC